MKKFSLDKRKIRVLILEGIHENAEQYFRDNGYTNLEFYKEARPEKELEEKLEKIHILGIRSRTELTGSLL